MTIRVLIADDQSLVRAGMLMLLDAEPDIEVAGEAKDGLSAVEQAGTLKPDVVLMDVRMPGIDGVEATRRITSDGFGDGGDEPGHTIKVLVVTTYHVDEAVYAALRAGASGFLLKDAAPEDLVSAVRAVHSGGAWLAPPVARTLLGEFAARPERHTPGPEVLANLTQREREVLALVAHGLSNTEIAQRLFLGEATVKTHLSRILMKLGVRDRVQAVVAAYRTGLVRPEQ
jgi:DNA-binding NarL/FixJ family response regulator